MSFPEARDIDILLTFYDGRKRTVSVPGFRVVVPTQAPASQPKVWVAPPVSAPSATSPPTETIEKAIRIALLEKLEGMTGGQLVADILPQYPHKDWDKDSVLTVADRMRREGRLINRKADPGDGYKTGYLLPEWLESEQPNNE